VYASFALRQPRCRAALLRCVALLLPAPARAFAARVFAKRLAGERGESNAMLLCWLLKVRGKQWCCNYRKTSRLPPPGQ